MLEKLGFLHAAENRETFFARIAMLFPTRDRRYQAIEKAYNAAKDAFRETYREDGDRYFEHLRAVALILIVHLRVTNYKLIVAALLHDIVEDIPSWTVDRVEHEFGRKVALMVERLTKPPKNGITKEERDNIYHGRFAYAPRKFFLIKLADRLHNLITLWACPQDKRARKIEETKFHYLPYARQHLILLHELEEAIERLEAPSEVKDHEKEE